MPYTKSATFFMDGADHLFHWKGGFVLMIALVFFLIVYGSAFHFLTLPMEWYTHGIIVYFIVLRANKNLKTSLFSIFDIFQKVDLKNILEYLCALITRGYLYWRKEIPIDMEGVVTLLTFSIFFYLYLFRGIIGSPKFSLKKIFNLFHQA